MKHVILLAYPYRFFLFCVFCWFSGISAAYAADIWTPPAFREQANKLADSTPEALLAAGLAVVLPSPAPNQNWYDLEETARQAAKGLWASDEWRIKSAAETDLLLQQKNRFQIVRGTVTKTALKSEFLYLNFASDWRTDFSIGIRRANLPLFRKAGLSPQDWRGKDIEVRGWLFKLNGPFITVTHPAQLRVLD